MALLELLRHPGALRLGRPTRGHLLDGGALPQGEVLLDKPVTPQRLVTRVGEMLRG